MRSTSLSGISEFFCGTRSTMSIVFNSMIRPSASPSNNVPFFSSTIMPVWTLPDSATIVQVVIGGVISLFGLRIESNRTQPSQCKQGSAHIGCLFFLDQAVQKYQKRNASGGLSAAAQTKVAKLLPFFVFRWLGSHRHQKR